MKTQIASIIALTLLGLSGGCVTSKTKSHEPPRASLDQAARAMFEADVAFARMSAEQGIAAAFEFYTTPDSIQLPPVGPPVVGNRAIAQAMAGPPGSTLNWRPEGAQVALSGDFGVTWGNYEFRGADPDGRPLVNTGRYLTVWRRRPDGAWRATVDIGNVARP